MNNKKEPRELKKFSLNLQNLESLDNRKIQYDLLNLEEVLRVHVTEDGKAKIIASPEASLEKILSAIPEKHCPKVTEQKTINHAEVLKNTYNI